MPLDDIPEIPPYPIKHSIVLHPFLEVFRSAHDHDHDTHDEIENFGTIPPANFIPDTKPQPLSHAVDLFLIHDAHRSAFLECRPVPARHEVTLSSFANVSRPIPAMGAGSELMSAGSEVMSAGSELKSTGSEPMSAGSEPMSVSVGPQDPAACTSTTGTSDPHEALKHDESSPEETAPMHSAGRDTVDRAKNAFEHVPSSNMLITGGTFVTVEGGTHTRDSTGTEGRKGMRKLGKMIAPGASHNSAERYDPPKCHPETRKAVLKKIMDWVQGLEDSERRCFFMWLYGPAGAGKSAIAQTIAELCHELKLLAASFFFSRTAAGRSDDSRLIATLSYQLCLAIPEIRTYVEDAVELNPLVFSLSIKNQLQTLILDPLTHFHDNLSRYHGHIHPMLIIIDGLDECTSANYVQRYVLQVLAEKLPIPMFFLVTSRPEPYIRGFFTVEPMASITTTLALDDSYQPDADIEAFLKAKFDVIKRDHPLGRELPESWPSTVHIDNLVRKSSGQFIYASTVMKYVESPRHWPTKRLEMIFGNMDRGKDTPFATLDALYTWIFSSVEDINTVLEVFSVLLLVKPKTTLKTPALIEDLLGLQRGDLNIALIDLHSILDIPAQPDEGEIRILHASLEHFLLDGTRSGPYHINQGYAHAKLTQRFIKCIPQKVTDNDNISVLYGLSSAIFTMHCSQSYATEELLDALWTFDISAFWELYFSGNWNQTFTSELGITRASQLSDFFTWLENNGSSKKGQDLYSHYISTWDGYMRHSLTQLSLGPLESQLIVFFVLNKIRNNYPAHDVFNPATFGADYGLFSNISATLKLHDGDPRYHLLLAEFFGDPSRSGPFYLDGDKYANFAMTFTDYILSPRAGQQNWEHDLSCLSIILSKASFSKELATLLDSTLVNRVKARNLDLAQTAADIVKAYCSNPQSSSDNRSTAPHIEDSDPVIGESR